MQEILIRKLHDYIRDNNPDLLLTLEEENRVTDYLYDTVASVDHLINQLFADNKPSAFIEEHCMEEMTRQLKPSRFNYLKTILEDEFPGEFERLHHTGILETEIINLISVCDPVFHELNFSEENDNDRYLRYAITGAVYEYFKVNSGK
ncbi:MAG: hypothetical protein ABI688_09125 [Bacteroidota bacterium]